MTPIIDREVADGKSWEVRLSEGGGCRSGVVDDPLNFLTEWMRVSVTLRSPAQSIVISSGLWIVLLEAPPNSVMRLTSGGAESEAGTVARPEETSWLCDIGDEMALSAVVEH